MEVGCWKLRPNQEVQPWGFFSSYFQPPTSCFQFGGVSSPPQICTGLVICKCYCSGSVTWPMKRMEPVLWSTMLKKKGRSMIM